MALIGRHKAPCLGCGFAAPHVKKNDGKRAYVHCPECGFTATARNGNQEAHLLANTRPELHELPRRADDIEVKTNAPNTRPAAVPPAGPAAAPGAAELPGVRGVAGGATAADAASAAQNRHAGPAPAKRAGWTTLLG